MITSPLRYDRIHVPTLLELSTLSSSNVILYDDNARNRLPQVVLQRCLRARYRMLLKNVHFPAKFYVNFCRNPVHKIRTSRMYNLSRSDLHHLAPAVAVVVATHYNVHAAISSSEYEDLEVLLTDICSRTFCECTDAFVKCVKRILDTVAAHSSHNAMLLASTALYSIPPPIAPLRNVLLEYSGRVLESDVFYPYYAAGSGMHEAVHLNLGDVNLPLRMRNEFSMTINTEFDIAYDEQPDSGVSYDCEWTVVSMLSMAVMAGDLRMVNMLLERGAHLTEPMHQCVCIALNRVYLDVLDLLYDHKELSRTNPCVLWRAVSTARAARWLIDHDVIMDHNVMVFPYCNHVDVLELLIERGLITITDPWIRMVFSNYPDLSVIDYIIRKSVPLHIDVLSIGMHEAPHYACYFKYLGGDVNVIDDLYHWTPLHRECERITYDNYISAIDVLVLCGADVHAVDGDGRTPLDIAKLGGANVKIQSLLS